MRDVMYAKALEAKFWEKVRNDAAYRVFVDELLERFASLAAEPIVADSFYKFDMFRANGNRNIFQEAYFRKRERLVVCAMLSLIYPEHTDYLHMLENIIWAICDEYTWSLPAHISWAPDERTDVDLFASETGYALAEIVCVLKERINPRIYKRVCEEIRRRIIESYEMRVYDWEKASSNWAAVCAGSVAITYMYMAPERFEAVKPRLQKTIEGFLGGYSEDGICYEGLGYWEYGFGFFVTYAQHLYEFTNGEENYFAREKVHRIAAFQQITNLGGVSSSFSDVAGDKLTSCPAIYGALQLHYPEIATPPRSTYRLFDHCSRWQRVFDAFVYLPENVDEETRDYERFSAEAGLYTRRSAAYGFAAKAGANDEPHNHNDVGHFIFAVNGEQILCDLGAGEYVSGYFERKTRYNYLCNCSRGHSLPIVDGKLQSDGTEFNGTMTYENNILTIDISKAYATNVRIIRSFAFDEKCVALTDTFEKAGGGVQVTERFVTMIAPELREDGVWIHNVRLSADTGWSVQVTEDIFVDHFAVKRPVYLIDFTAEKASVFEMKIELA